MISLSLFLFGCLNEIFVVTGLAPTYTLSSVSCIFGFIFYTFEVNERVVHAYGELKFLRSNLQSEVDKKTALLAGALDQVQAQQAELVQSAKLASLGTLSAGIAHEINNSLNFVNGAIRPIEKILANVDLGPHRPKVNLLFKTANEGLALTFGIIRSLRNYTGLNQAAFKDVGILETVHGVCNLIHSKLTGIDLQLAIPADLTLYGSVVGINQILMNLIDNAVDAMDGRGTITISAVLSQEAVILTVADNGKGISRGVVDRIFEPFFTTKEVGRGTGLGLHIVHMEMQKHKGKLTVQSEEGFGTTFRLEFPLINFATSSEAT